MVNNTNAYGEAIWDTAGKVAQNRANEQKTEATESHKPFIERNAQNTEALSQSENELLARQRIQDWYTTGENILHAQNASKLIDDKLKENFPKGVIRAYKDGAFGEKGSKDAKSTMGNAVLGILADTIGGLGNAAGSIVGKAPAYESGANWYGNMQKENLKQAMENKWLKEKGTTEAAVKAVGDRIKNEEAAQTAVQMMTSNARMQSEFNKMTQEEKEFAIEVYQQIGEHLGKLNDPQMLNLITGGLASGMDPKEAGMMLLVRYSPGTAKAFYEKMTGEPFPGNFEDALKGLGNGSEGGINKGSNSSGTTLTFSDGSTVNVSKYAGRDDFSNLQKKATEIEQNWFNNGDEEQFMNDYKVLYDEWQNHPHANKEKGWFSAGTFMEPNEMLKTMKERRTGYLSALEERTKASNALKSATTNKEKRTAQKEYEAAQKKVNSYLGK